MDYRLHIGLGVRGAGIGPLGDQETDRLHLTVAEIGGQVLDQIVPFMLAEGAI
jgi:hypothetical protein